MGVTIETKKYNPLGIEFNLNLNAQYAEQEVFSQELFSIGGIGSVRGFTKNQIAEEKGVSIQNEVVFKPYYWFDRSEEFLSYLSLLIQQ